MDRIEAAERVGIDVRAALEELREERPEERRRAVDVDPDGRRPVGGLIPREQVAGEAFGESEREQQHADDPVQLTWIFVRAEQKHAAHVQEHQDDEHRRAPAMHAADEPPRPHVVRDVHDRRVGGLRVGLVVHREDHTRQCLDQERGECRRAERLEPVGVARHLPESDFSPLLGRSIVILRP